MNSCVKTWKKTPHLLTVWTCVRLSFTFFVHQKVKSPVNVDEKKPKIQFVLDHCFLQVKFTETRNVEWLDKLSVCINVICYSIKYLFVAQNSIRVIVNQPMYDDIDCRHLPKNGARGSFLLPIDIVRHDKHLEIRFFIFNKSWWLHTHDTKIVIMKIDAARCARNCRKHIANIILYMHTCEKQQCCRRKSPRKYYIA